MPRLPLPPSLAALNPIDMRDALAALPKKRSDEIGRQRDKRTVTIHYAGTDEPGATTDDAALAQIRSEARYHIGKIWGYYDPKTNKRPIYGDGIMYHLAVLPSGRPVIMRELDAILYHCANSVGNRASVAVTTLRGIGQPMTDQHWHGVELVCDALVRDYVMGSREAVKGHREWPRDDHTGQSICPGSLIFERVLSYRDTSSHATGLPLGTYEVITPDGLSVREGPNVGYDRSLITKQNPKGLIYPKGRRFEAGAIVPDDKGMQRLWLWDATGVGFAAADKDLVKFVGA